MKTGVYLNRNRNSAIVVKVADGTVHYLSHISGHIQLLSCGELRFVEDWPLPMANKKPIAALMQYWKSGLDATPKAIKVMEHILTNHMQRTTGNANLETSYSGAQHDEGHYVQRRVQQAKEAGLES